MTDLVLKHGLSFSDLYERDGLVRVDRAFVGHLAETDVALHNRLMAARSDPDGLGRHEESSLLVALAPYLEDFIADLFGIAAEVRALQARHSALAPLYAVKRLFVQRRAVKGIDAAAAAALDGPGLAHRLAMQRLVPVETVARDGVLMLCLPAEKRRRRQGFALTDPGTDLTGALDQANYCIWCHNQGKDSCSRGLREKDGSFKKSVFGVTLTGCPLEEKISEMNLVKARGYSLGALALVAVDNPLCAATGHRICNDCMKACIYQRQDPVDIPQIETRTLKDVLALPWGFEIYSLLTRWNPLDLRRPLPKPPSGYKVLVVGLGPAGFTLAHHLINDGHFVAAIDGLKIEPLPAELVGDGFAPVRDVAALYERLDERVMAGFGGVAEYGITVRWDKNFLKIVRLLIERRRQFAMYG